MGRRLVCPYGEASRWVLVRVGRAAAAQYAAAVRLAVKRGDSIAARRAAALAVHLTRQAAR